MLNAFLPATELDDPDRFAGRGPQVRMLADSLHMTGSTPLIFGDRGLGKSSLAAQLQLIAMGSSELLAHLNSERLALDEDETFLTFNFTCTDSTESLTDLLQAMINLAESVELSSAGGAKTLVSRVTRKKVAARVIELESTKTYATEASRLSYQDLNHEEKLLQLCEILTKTYSMPVLFIIDELDRLKSTDGLASFLKAYSTENLKFVLVGIASTVSDLIADHKSMERKLTPVHVKIMPPEELAQIVVKAQAYLNDEGFDVTFSVNAMQELIKVSAGFPWFVHVLGQECLQAADEEGLKTIEGKHVARAVENIVTNLKAQQYEDRYRMAVQDSVMREKALRVLAHWTDQDIPTSEIYWILKTNLGVNNGSIYRGHLIKDEYGSIIYDPRLSKRGLVRFRDEMFKAYVRMRSSIYEGVKEDVIKAYQNLHQN